MALALTKDLYRGKEQKKDSCLHRRADSPVPHGGPQHRRLNAAILLVAEHLHGSGRPHTSGAVWFFPPKGAHDHEARRHRRCPGRAIRRYGRLGRNGAYMVFTLAFSVMGFSFFAFIGGSSYIYILNFGMTEQVYSLYFAFNAFALMLGSLLCARVLVNFESRRILLISLVGMFFSTGAVLIPGKATPTNFALSMFAYSLFLGMSRPISNHLILKQVRQDTGTASSLLTFFNFLCAAIAMELISLDWSSKPMVIAVMGMVGSTIPFAAILAMKREK